MALCLAFGCQDKAGPGSDAGSGPWLPPWSGDTIFRAVTAGSLSELGVPGDSGPGDTATPMEASWRATFAEAGGGYTWTLADGEDATASALSLSLEATGDLVVTAVNGTTYATPVVLVGEVFEEGVAVKSGEFTTTTTNLPSLSTWYGVFQDVLEVTVEGPAGDPLVGGLRIVPSVGPVQFVLGAVGGDLAWYE